MCTAASPKPGSEAGALLLAAAGGCERSVELLLAAGADAKHVGRSGATALHAAAAVDHEEGKAVAIVGQLLKVLKADGSTSQPVPPCLPAGQLHKPLLVANLILIPSLPSFLLPRNQKALMTSSA